MSEQIPKWLEDKVEELYRVNKFYKEQNMVLSKRLAHLLQSKTIQLFDEYDLATNDYKRDIRRLDTYGVVNQVLKHDKLRKGTPTLQGEKPKETTMPGNLYALTCSYRKEAEKSYKKLKPCPFCGNTEPHVRKVGNGYAVICGICGARGGRVIIKEWHDHKFIAQGQAADFWNRRKETDR